MKLRKGDRPFYALWLLFGLSLFQSISLLLWYWPGALPDAITSGAWTALAYDFSEGIFYRPIWSENGFGGTRYMPIFFVLHGCLMRLFGDPVLAGVFLSLFSALLLGIGLCLILRELDLPWRLALPFAGIINCTISYQMTTLSIRGDFLAAAFNAWAVFCGLKFVKSRSHTFLMLTLILFIGAFLTKVTSLFGLLAVTFYLFSSDHKKYALRLILGTGMGMGASLALIYYLSDGRVLQSFLECAFGGMDLAYAGGLFIRFFYEIIRDPLLSVLFFPAVAILILRFSKDRRKLPMLLFGVTLAFTLLIYSSPGTASNHLVDLQVMMVVLLATVFLAGHYRKWISTAFVINSLLIILSWLPGTPSVKGFFREHQIPSRASVEHLKKSLEGTTSPVFSQNPMFPILMTQRPFTSDFFNLNRLVSKYPAMREDLAEKITLQYFGAVIFSNWPGIFKKDIESTDDPHLWEKMDEFNRTSRMEKGLMELITEYYEIRYVQRPYVFYFPKGLSNRGFGEIR